MRRLATVSVSAKSRRGLTVTDGNVILWVPSDKPTATFGETAEEVPDKEHWRPQKMLQWVHSSCTEAHNFRVTNKHVLDIAWSPDGEFIIAGSTDNTATIWKAATGEQERLCTC